MRRVAVIGGTGMNRWSGFEPLQAAEAQTPYGAASGAPQIGRFAGVEVVFLARHGEGHRLPPHAINYRANVWALRAAGAHCIVGIGAVGGIADWMPPAALALPRDLIDYTWGRAHTYSDGSPGAPLDHVDMTQPYDEALRAQLLDASKATGVAFDGEGVLAVTQGPRLETPAEILRMKRDGCDMVGMTGMPEAALARELALPYASLGVSVNWAAGLGKVGIHDEIHQSIEEGMNKVQLLLQHLVRALA